MPQLIEIQQKYGARNNFALVSVTKDNGRYMAGLHQLIEQRGIRYPVLWLGEDAALQQRLNRYASGIPATYLVTPGGRILAECQINDDLIRVLGDLLDYRHPIHPVTITATPSWQTDSSLLVKLACINPNAQAMPLKLHAGYGTHEYDPDYDYNHTGKPNVSRWIDYQSPLLDGLSLAPGAHELSFRIPYNAQAVSYQCSISATIPGTEAFGGGHGLEVSTSIFEWARPATD